MDDTEFNNINKRLSRASRMKQSERTKKHKQYQSQESIEKVPQSILKQTSISTNHKNLVRKTEQNIVQPLQSDIPINLNMGQNTASHAV